MNQLAVPATVPPQRVEIKGIGQESSTTVLEQLQAANSSVTLREVLQKWPQDTSSPRDGKSASEEPKPVTFPVGRVTAKKRVAPEVKSGNSSA
ncbi:unnamed protein product, partial [Mesorhabditis spiculigera]